MRVNRYRYLDILKVIAIFFVCVYHFWHGEDEISFEFFKFLRDFSYPILSTCVPLFFAVNGALLLDRNSYDAKKHLKKLLFFFMQFCVWHGITLAILGLCDNFDFSTLSKSQIINIFLFLGDLDGIRVNHFWFIRVFCCIYLLYPFLGAIFSREHLDSNARLSLIGLIGVLFVCNFLIPDFRNFRAISPYLKNLNMDPLVTFEPFNYYIGIMLIYFFAGGFLHKYRSKTEKIPMIGCILLILVGLSLSYATMCIKAWQGELDYDIVFEGYGSTGTFLCTIGIFLLASKAEKLLPPDGVFMDAVRMVGRNTMTVYYTHWFGGILIEELLPVGYSFFWNVFHAGLLVIGGSLLGEIMKLIPVLKYLIYGS